MKNKTNARIRARMGVESQKGGDNDLVLGRKRPESEKNDSMEKTDMMESHLGFYFYSCRERRSKCGSEEGR